MDKEWEEQDRLAMEAAELAQAKLAEQRIYESERRKKLMKTSLRFAVITVAFIGIIALIIPMIRPTGVPSIRKRGSMDIFTNIPADQVVVAEKPVRKAPEPVKVAEAPSPARITAPVSRINKVLFDEAYANLAKAEPAIESIRAQGEDIRKWLRQ